jgi:hypothetical protein
MQRRKWFLFAAGGFVFFAYAFIRFNLVLNLYPTYGDADIYACSALAGVCALCWTVLEVAEHVMRGRPVTCSCGYSMAGMKCPECGRAVAGGGMGRGPG